MRLSLAISLITIAFALPSCASTSIGGTRVYGRALHRVTAADIRAAIDADKRTSGEHKMFGEINEVDVVSTDEIHIYHGRRLEVSGRTASFYASTESGGMQVRF
jgi:hypothetical protein